MKQKVKKATVKEIPPEIVAICERPGYLEHLQGQRFRVTVTGLDAQTKKWMPLTQDEGNELWLLEYPPHSKMAHYCLQGVEPPPPNWEKSLENNNVLPF